ncbi:MAG: histidine phosphatase family protein [Bacteroidales bacterium]|nr:histidine phosphatase family protein [Bacteroidales bacterium]MBN2762132.1 histidine phosphatase family protein [Bacteroidales bacterium]
MKKKHKVLYIVRHGKSNWDYDNIADIDRPLKSKGIKGAYETARNIKLKSNIPDLIISSPANRALHTALIFTRVFGLSAGKIRIDEGLYESCVSYCLEKIRETDEAITTLMIFGHNPDFTDLANQFLTETISNLPTAGTVRLEFSADTWKNVDRSNLTKHTFIFPVKENGNY